MPDLPSRAVVSNAALAALAVPARFALLNHLLAAGPRTASQCAEVIGETPSNCSWHLRALAKVGLVEPAPEKSADGRTRPWRATAVGFDFSGDPGPAGAIARNAGGHVRGVRRGSLPPLSRAEEVLPEEWTEVSGTGSYSLELTPEELRALAAALDQLIRPYVRSIRDDAPAGSAVVHVSLRAFLNPDAQESQP